MRSHLSKAFSYTEGSDLYLYRAVRKYGWDSFTKEILVDNLTREQGNIKEQYYIKKYKSNNPKFGYNLTVGGDSAITHSKLTVKQAHEIIELLKNTDMTMVDIALKYGVSRTTISNINSGIKWRENIDYPIRHYGFSNDFLNILIKELIENELSIHNIAKKYNVSYEMVRRFNSGQTHKGYYHSYPIRKKSKKNMKRW